MNTPKYPLQRFLLGFLLAAAAIAAPLAVHAQAATKQERLIVVYKEGAANAARAAVVRAGGRVVLDLGEVNAVAVRLPSASIALLRGVPGVEMVEADPMRYVMGRTSSADRSGALVIGGEQVPYGIGMVQANQLPYDPAGNRKVCIVDSGYDLAHEDLQHTLITGDNLSGSGDWSTDENDHGTHVAGTIAALGSNGLGVVGVVSSGQMPLHIAKVFDASGSAPSSAIIKAVLRCVRAKANIISMSLGGAGATQFEQKIYQFVADRGTLVIAAAGNDGTSGTSYPAGYPSVMSVAAVDANTDRGSFSQFNADVEIAAPGVGVLSTIPMGAGRQATTSVGGTSYVVQPMDGTPLANVTAPLADFGLGLAASPGSMTGKVCLISRGNISFSDKVLNCQNSGGAGAIIYNNTTGDLFGTLNGVVTTIPSVGATQADGANMLTKLGQSANVNVTATNYAYFNGTSMATPHVSAVAALVWSHYPTACTAEKLRTSLTRSALDLGPAGRDDEYGAGLVQAKAAFDRIASLGCGN